MKGFLAAIGFLTVLPVHGDEAQLKKAPSYFPLAGLLIGVLLIIADSIFSFALPSLPAAFLVVAFLCLLTGMMHLDGLADTADSLGAHTPEDRLKVMKDLSTGVFGATALVLLLIGKIALLASLQGSFRLSILLLMPVIARWTMLALISTSAYVRRQGLGKVFTEGGRGIALLTNGSLIIGLSVFSLGWYSLPLLFLIVAIPAFLSQAFVRLFGGITGDTLGASCEISELMVLLTASTMAS